MYGFNSSLHISFFSLSSNRRALKYVVVYVVIYYSKYNVI